MNSDVVDILKNLISIDSQCIKSNKRIIDYISAFFENSSKFSCQLFSYNKANSDNLELYNLVVKIKGKSSVSPLVFVAHTDTVPASSFWKNQEFVAVEKEGKIFGLGSCDMKAGLACMISSALSLDKIPEQDIFLVFDSDEELNGEGGRRIVKELNFSNARIVVAEPSSKKIFYKQKGCLDMEIVSKGVSLHSSKTNSKNNLENNAIYKMNLIINQLFEYEKSIEEKQDSDLGKASFNIGFISGGTSANVVADSCSILVSRRLLPFENIDLEADKINSICEDVVSDCESKIVFYGQSFSSNKEGNFAKQLEKLSSKYLNICEFGFMSAWTEAALFSNFGETFIFGPGDISLCHVPFEYVFVSDLRAFVKIYFDLMNS